MKGFRWGRLWTAGTLLFFLVSALLPLPALWEGEGARSSASFAPRSPLPAETSGSFRVLRTATGKIEKVPRDEYLFGVVACEMGGKAPLEALKAQTVAAFTFALYRAGERAGEAYDLTDDPARDQAWLSREEIRTKWGKEYQALADAVDGAVAAVRDYRLVDDDGAPVMAAYHAVSSGRTESALIAWGVDKSYLQPVESVGDLLSPDYLSTCTFTYAELAEKLASDVTLTGEGAGWLGKTDWSPSGTVTEMAWGGVTLTGARLRELLGLRSAAFQVEPAEGGYVFRVKGYGHGVGMSQYGACYMARCGSTFVEILSHYYTGCKMVRS